MFRVIHGYAYTELINGQRKVLATGTNLKDPESFYYDEAIRLSPEDAQGFVGKPLCVDHDIGNQIGQITRVWVDRDNVMNIAARIDLSNPEGARVDKLLHEGSKASFSVGYTPDIRYNSDGTNTVERKIVEEISIVDRPFFDGCQVRVSCSKNSKLENKQYNIPSARYIIKVHAMSEETKPQELGGKDASEILKQLDLVMEQLRKTEQERQMALEKAEQASKAVEEEKAKLAEQYAPLVERKQREDAEYKKQQEAALNEVLAVHQDAYGQELPAEYKQNLLPVFTDTKSEAAKVHASIEISAARYAKKLREEKDAAEQKLTALQAEVEKLRNEQQETLQRVKASRDAVRDLDNKTTEAEPKAEDPAPRVAASHNSPFVSPFEHMLYKKAHYGAELDVSKLPKVAASADTKKYVSQAPRHALLKNPKIKDLSMRSYAPRLFDHIVARDSEEIYRATTHKPDAVRVSHFDFKDQILDPRAIE